MEISNFQIVLISILALLYFYIKRKYSYWELRGVPNIKPIIPFGNLKELGRTEQISTLVHKCYRQMKGQGSSFFGIYFFQRPMAVAIDLELIKNILIKDFKSFTERDVYYNEKSDPLSAHLFSIDGEKWRKLRTKLSPTFTSGKMKFMYPTVVKVGEQLKESLTELIDGQQDLEIQDMLARFTTDIIGTCAFGIECNSLKDPNAEFRRMGRKVFEKPRHNFLVTFLIGSCKRVATLLGARLFHDDVSTFFMKIVKETVELRERNRIQRNDFMDILINLKNQELGSLTINEIAAQAFIFFLAGFETSSTLMAFFLYEMALNPDIQKKVRCEIENVLRKYDGQCSYEAMLDMPYLDQVMNESMRKYPPVGLLIRSANEDYRILDTEHILEKNTAIMIPVLAIHRDPDYYPDPDRFDPERFSADAIAERNSCLFLPFGEGPRNCIGLRFGMMQSRIGLISLMRNFEFSVCKNTKIPLTYAKSTLIFSPEGGMWLNVRKL